MLASHTLVVVGVPLSRVMRRVSQVRDQQYSLLRGLFAGVAEQGGSEVARLHAVTLEAEAYAVGRELTQIMPAFDGVQVRAVRRPGARARLAPAEAGPLQAGDIVVLLGEPERLLAAEERLLRG
jgi:CPA2 family monovalent cation:H+ antiporter-2